MACMQASERACQWAIDYVLRPGMPSNLRVADMFVLTVSKIRTLLQIRCSCCYAHHGWIVPPLSPPCAGDVLHLVHCIDSPADYWVGPDDTAIVYSDPATDGRDVSRCGFLCSLRGHAGSCMMTHCIGINVQDDCLISSVCRPGPSALSKTRLCPSCRVRHAR
jgi:hypothetical protein